MDTTRRDPHVLPLPPGAAPQRPTARLGPFRIERELARGGMGVVHVAFHEGLGRQVALKLLRAGSGAEAEDVERFRFEAQAAARLKHPHIVGIHDVGQAPGGGWYLAMDLVDGESLQARLSREGPLAPEQAARLLEVIARAVHYAHGRGILHRDLKPHNVLVDRAGEPHLTDFGLAKDASRAETGLTVTGQVLGTPAYMSPEQASGDPALVDRRSDVWGLGATLYAALTGRPPYEGASVVNIMAALCSRDPAPPSTLRAGLDRDLETIVMTCLEREPGRRYASAEGLADDLARWLRDEPIQARRVGALGRAAKWARRNRALAAVALGATALVGVVLVAAVGWVVWERASTRAAAVADARAEAELRRGELDGGANTGRALRALQAAERWHALAPADPTARALHVEAALRLSDLARETRQWDLALAAAETVATVDPEAARARADLATDARDAEERAHVEAARAVLDRAARGDVEGEEERFDAVFEVVKHASPATVDLLVERLEALLATVAEGRAVAAPELDAGRIICNALGRIGAGDARAEETLLRLLESTPDETLALEAGRALVLLGTPRGAQAVVAAIERSGRRSVVGAGLARALGRLPDLAALLPDVHDDVEASISRISLLTGAGDLEGAVALATDLVNRHPGHAGAAQALAGSELSRGAYAEAERWATRALALDPELAGALYVRSRARVRRGERQGALADAARAVELDPTPQHLIGQAEVLAWTGQHAAAIEVVDRAVRASPADFEGRDLLAQLLLEVGDHPRALAAAEAALRIIPDHGPARHVRGRALMALGRVDEGLADLARAVELMPMSAPVWADLGLARWEASKDLEGATKAWGRALELAPDSAVTWANRGHARFVTGDAAGARADLDRALELDPRIVHARHERASLRALVGDVAGAVSDLDLLLELQPDHQHALTARGKLRLRLGDTTLAEADFTRVIELAPGTGDGYTWRGVVRLQRGDARAALGDLDRALELLPTSADALMVRGQARLTLGDRAGATADFRRMLEVAPSHPRAGEVRGVLDQLGAQR